MNMSAKSTSPDLTANVAALYRALAKKIPNTDLRLTRICYQVFWGMADEGLTTAVCLLPIHHPVVDLGPEGEHFPSHTGVRKHLVKIP